MNNPKEALSFINEGERFLVSTHVNPDGDGVGSVMALKWLILKKGKEADIIIESPPPKTLDYFENYDWVCQFGEEGTPTGEYDRVIIADAPNRSRLGKVAGQIGENAAVLIIDHHPSDEPSGAARFIDEGASSSAELVHRLIRADGESLDKACAEYLYSGVLIDTGRFRFSNTSSATLRCAADLLEAGAPPADISERLFFHNTYETTMALGRMINTLETHLDGKVATVEFDYEFVSSDEWKKVDTEGFVNHPLAIIGVEVAALLREVKPGVTRASLRAKHDFNVNLLANEFGGGGHAKAAGLTINDPLSIAKAKLLDAIAIRIKRG